jgi:hypothetical protein
MLLLNLTGKRIRRILPGSVEFEDGTVILGLVLLDRQPPSERENVKTKDLAPLPWGASPPTTLALRFT